MGSASDSQVQLNNLAQINLLNRISNRIRQSLELQEILDATVTEIRAFLQTDRVKVYRFLPDHSGQVIAESKAPNQLPSLLGLYFPAGDVPPTARELFIRARVRSIVNVPEQQITLSRTASLPTTGDLTLEDLQTQPIADILQRPVDPCHVEYLTAMGVQSSLVMPLMHNQTLWGLLASHHAKPKVFTETELQVVQLLADQVSIAISQSHLLIQEREKVQRETLINQISTLLHAPLQIQEILQNVLERITHGLQAAGGRLYLISGGNYIEGELYTCGAQPDLTHLPSSFLEETTFWQQLLNLHESDGFPSPKNWTGELLEMPLPYLQTFSGINYQVWAVNDLYQDPQLARISDCFDPVSIRSVLAISLCYGKQMLGCLTLFRKEIDTDIFWAGRFDPDDRQQRVRHSFEAWRELKRGQAQEWKPSEINLGLALATHLTMAVMQNRLFQCEREQRVLVEMRNQELNVARLIAEEANRLKSDFLSSTSHELRTPLASILNYLKLLQKGFYDSHEELQEYVDIAHQSAENLIAIINDVLDITKIEAGRMVASLETVNLQEMLAEQKALFHPDSCRKAIPLTLDCEVERVIADRGKLRQILTNLLSNAFKFTHAGTICIRALRREINGNWMAEIAVIDSGIGIDANKKDLVFDPFVQEDGSIKRRYGGTGLGLTICKRLVELMHGHIWLESEGKDRGTTVTFTLPISPTNPSL